ncbi:MAG: hypothetical protein KAR45_10340, partial [Desulfobacteraceae bacterium]|nr:hypothetical protein [Desulfobacteraceae bacterium]
ETKKLNLVLAGYKDKKWHKNVRGDGTWTLTRQKDKWLFQIHPNKAPLSEMMVPIEAIMEEE